MLFTRLFPAAGSCPTLSKLPILRRGPSKHIISIVATFIFSLIAPSCGLFLSPSSILHVFLSYEDGQIQLGLLEAHILALFHFRDILVVHARLLLLSMTGKSTARRYAQAEARDGKTGGKCVEKRLDV